MTLEQIIEIFVRACEVDRKLPNTARPAALKAMNFGYVHDETDIHGWDAEDKENLRWAWLDPNKLRNSRNDMGLWYAAMELIKLETKEANRRSLWAWARSEAGGEAFAKWCKKTEGISRQLGDWRKNSALTHIHAAMNACKPLQHNDNSGLGDFTNEPEIGHKSVIIRVLRDDDARPMACNFDTDLNGFDWANAQNERRRQREERRKQAA